MEFARLEQVQGGEPFFLLRGHRPAFFFSRLGFELELKRNIVFLDVLPRAAVAPFARFSGERGIFVPLPPALIKLIIRLIETERTVSLCRRLAS